MLSEGIIVQMVGQAYRLVVTLVDGERCRPRLHGINVDGAIERHPDSPEFQVSAPFRGVPNAVDVLVELGNRIRELAEGFELFLSRLQHVSTQSTFGRGQFVSQQ